MDSIKIKNISNQLGLQTEEFVQRLIFLILLVKMTHKNGYGSVIQFLCSKASSYLNGQNIVVDGGRRVL